MIESVANAVDNPFEVISSEDLLSRIEDFNRLVKQTREDKFKENPKSDWDWRQDWMTQSQSIL